MTNFQVCLRREEGSLKTRTTPVLILFYPIQLIRSRFTPPDLTLSPFPNHLNNKNENKNKRKRTLILEWRIYVESPGRRGAKKEVF